MQKELALGKPGQTEFADVEKSQYLYSVAAILDSMAEFAGRGFSIFNGQPSLRIPGVDVDNSDSLLRAAKRFKTASKVIEGKKA